jgi:hypothetical protein
MRDIKEIFERIQEQKREQREINKSVKDALKNSLEFHELGEQIDRLKVKKAQIENSLKGELEQKIDLLKLNIKDGIQAMSDIALTTLMKGESIKLTDSEDNEYEPIFSIRFKKTSNKSFAEKESGSDGAKKPEEV